MRREEYYAAIDRYKQNHLEHHGVLGQKWGVRRYQNYDGTRIKTSGDMVLKKGSSLIRYTNRKETGSLEGKYASITENDMNQYLVDAKQSRLSFTNYDKLFATKISAIDDVTIRKGSAIVADLVEKIGDKSIKESYDVLNKLGYLDDMKDSFARMKIWQSTEEGRQARSKLGSAFHNYLYSNKDNAKNEINEYKKKGYDAIVDPEDFIWNYERPLIITNDKNFKRNPSKVVYDKSFDTYKKEKSEGAFDFTDEDRKNIDKILKRSKKGGTNGR